MGRRVDKLDGEPTPDWFAQQMHELAQEEALRKKQELTQEEYEEWAKGLESEYKITE